jgi:L-asparaginase/Glu-tRNA(Gln) amidotransferase subunit D
MTKLATVSTLVALTVWLPQETGAQEKLPRVVVLATGGTIASTYDKGKGGLASALSGEQLVDAVPELKKYARIETEQISNINSADMNPDIWLRLVKCTNELLAVPDIAGVVVTHGTDTLEETAYFLDLTVSSTPALSWFPEVFLRRRITNLRPDPPAAPQDVSAAELI